MLCCESCLLFIVLLLFWLYLILVFALLVVRIIAFWRGYIVLYYRVAQYFRNFCGCWCLKVKVDQHLHDPAAQLRHLSYKTPLSVTTVHSLLVCLKWITYSVFCFAFHQLTATMKCKYHWAHSMGYQNWTYIGLTWLKFARLSLENQRILLVLSER